MSNQLSKVRLWSAWGVLVLFYAYQYMLRVVPNILLPYMQEKFGVDGVIFGQFSGIYYTGYALAHLPLGLLVSRYGLKKIFPWAILIAGSGLWPLIYTDIWVYPIIGRALTGIGSSFSIIAVFHFLTVAFPAKKFAKLLSVIVSIGLIAAIYAGAPLAYLVDAFGYRNIVNALMLGGLILSILSYFIFCEEEQSGQIGLKEALTVFSNKKVIVTALASGLMVGALEGFPDAWGAAFLSMKYNLSNAEAAQVTSFIFFGMLIGCPFCSWLASYKNRYFQTLIALGAIMAGGFFIALLTTSLPYFALSALFVAVGVCCSYQVPAIYLGSSFVTPKLASMTATLMNMIIMTFGHIMHTIIGISVDKMGGLSSLNAIESSLTVIPVACTIGTVLLFSLGKRIRSI